MPVIATVYSLSATPKFEETMQYGWEGQITLKLNTKVLSPKVCSEIFQKLSQALDEVKDNLDTFTGSISLDTWKTEAEEQIEEVERQRKRFESIVIEEGETLRDAVLREERAKTYKIDQKTLDFINIAFDSIDPLAYDTITLEEIRED